MLIKFYKFITAIFLFIIILSPYALGQTVKNSIYIFTLFLLLPVILNFKHLKENIARQFRKRDYSLGFFVLFLILLFISTLFSRDLKLSLDYFLLYISCFIAFVGIKFLFKENDNKEFFFIIFIIITFIASLISLYNTVFLHLVNLTANGVSFLWIYFGHNHLAGILLFAIPLNFYLLFTHFRNKQTFFLLIIIAIVFFLAFFFTYARAATFALVLAILLSIFIFKSKFGLMSRFSLKQRLITGMVFLLFFLNALLGIKILINKKLDIKKSNERTMEKSLDWQKQAFINFLSHPWLGSGPDTFRYVNRKFEKLYYLRTDYSHDLLTQTLSDTGITGFLFLLGLLFSVFFNLYKRLQDRAVDNNRRFFNFVLWLGLFAFFLNGLADFDWQLPGGVFIFWLVAGLIY